MNHYHYIIVGQGIAGTLLSYFLQQKEKSILVIDNHHKGAASAVAAGIINPITGRKFVKSWRYEEFISVAASTYAEISTFLDAEIYAKKNIVRALHSNEEINNWSVRNAFPGYAPFFEEQADIGDFEKMVKKPFGYGEITGSGQLLQPNLIKKYKTYLQNENRLLSEVFDYKALKINEESVQYKNIEAGRIIFCEGWSVHRNPYFNYLPFNPAKGEVLIVRIPNFKPIKMLKHDLFLVPLGEALYWVGSNYIWKFEDDKPTEEGYQFLKGKLDQFLTVPYEIIEHKAAVRPTVKNRRPIIGFHPMIKSIAIFNGLGTKGASLGPFWAKHFVEYLEGSLEDLDREISIERYLNVI